MIQSDYLARAELYLGRDSDTALALGARGFATAAKALRFAFEEAAPVSLHGAQLHIGDRVFAGKRLFALYHDCAYPLRRKH